MHLSARQNRDHYGGSMLIRSIMQYLKHSSPKSLSELACLFHVHQTVMRPILALLVRKGRIQKQRTEPLRCASKCASHCGTQAVVERYEWVG